MQNKKKVISVILALIIALGAWSVVPFTANAAEVNTATTGATIDEAYPDFEYDVLDKGTAEIAKYIGEGGDVTIPSTLDGYTVTGIGFFAFEYCTSLTSIAIPDSVTSIGDYAFDGCTELTNIDIPDSVTYIGGSAFYNCRKLTSIDIPDSVTSIGNNAFSDTAWYENQPDGLIYAGKVAYTIKGKCPTEVIIKDGTLGIAQGAFISCTELMSITVPNSVTSIGDHAFRYYFDEEGRDFPIKSFTIYGYTGSASEKYANDNRFTFVSIGESTPDEATPDEANDDFSYSINDGKATVYGYFGTKTDVVIPDTLDGYPVTSIGEGAFENYPEMESIVIPASVTNIGSGVFWHCSGLKSIKVSEGNTVYDSRDNCNAVIKTNTNELIIGCMNTIIPDSVTSIGNNAFWYCSKLKNITIPDSVTSIDDSAFYSCTGLTSITIPDSVTSIGKYVFLYCSGLKSIKVTEGNSVYDSRDNCNAIIKTNTNELIVGCMNTDIPDSVTSIGSFAFKGYTGLTSVDIPDSVTSIGEGAFSHCTGLTSIDIPDTITSIDNSAFSDCTGLTSITIPDSVTSIGEGAFSRCTGLTSIDIPDSVKSLGDYAFYICTGLTSIDIPDSVTNIGSHTFDCCEGLTSVTIPDSVTSIGEGAFGYYTFIEDHHSYTDKVKGFTIYGYEGSEAEKYAEYNEFTFVPLKDKADKATGIILAVPEDTDLTVKDITSDISSKLPGNFNVLTAYDISLTKDGETVQPENIVPVKIPCTNENAKVFRLEADGTMTDMNAEYKDGYLVFTTDHFSVYVLAEPNVKTGVTVSGSITSYIDDSDVAVKLTGADNNFTAEVKGKSDYSIEAVPAGEYTLTVSKANHVTREYTVTVTDADVTQDVKICPKGDVNGDGETDIMDCSLAQRYIRELTTLDAYQIACGDVSGAGDGELDIQDVSRILRHIRELAMLY